MITTTPSILFNIIFCSFFPNVSIAFEVTSVVRVALSLSVSSFNELSITFYIIHQLTRFFCVNQSNIKINPYFPVPALLATVIKLLHLPQEAALLLRAYELDLVSSWRVWVRCLTESLSSSSNSLSDDSDNFIDRVTQYNNQVSQVRTWIFNRFHVNIVLKQCSCSSLIVVSLFTQESSFIERFIAPVACCNT